MRHTSFSQKDMVLIVTISAAVITPALLPKQTDDPFPKGGIKVIGI